MLGTEQEKYILGIMAIKLNSRYSTIPLEMSQNRKEWKRRKERLGRDRTLNGRIL